MSSTETCKGTSCDLRAAVVRTYSKYKRDTNSAKEMLSGVFSDEVDSKSRGDTGLRHLVVGLNKVIWITVVGLYLSEKLLFSRC